MRNCFNEKILPSGFLDTDKKCFKTSENFAGVRYRRVESYGRPSVWCTPSERVIKFTRLSSTGLQRLFGWKWNKLSVHDF